MKHEALEDFSVKQESCEEGLETFLGEFLKDRRKEVYHMKESSPEDFTEIRETAHKWMGYSRPYGFFHLEHLGQALREAAHQESIKDCQQVFNAAEKYLDEKEKHLQNSNLI